MNANDRLEAYIRMDSVPHAPQANCEDCGAPVPVELTRCNDCEHDRTPSEPSASGQTSNTAPPSRCHCRDYLGMKQPEGPCALYTADEPPAVCSVRATKLAR